MSGLRGLPRTVTRSRRNHFIERHFAAREVTNLLHVPHRYAVRLPLRHCGLRDVEMRGKTRRAPLLGFKPFDEIHAPSLVRAKPFGQDISKPNLFSIALQMANIRRERLLAWFNKAPCKGDRGKLIAASGLTKGRIAQLFDDEQPFGERAAEALAARLGLESSFFENDRSMSGAGISPARGSGSLTPGAIPTGAGHADATGSASLIPVPSAGSGSDSLALAVATIARHMRSADAMTRETVAPLLAKIAYAPNDAGRIVRMIESMIEAQRDRDTPAAAAEPTVYTDAPTSRNTPITGAEQDAVYEKILARRRVQRAADKTSAPIKRVVRKARGGAI